MLACVQVASDQVAAALKVKKGALVQSVPAGSTAAKAGLLPTRRGLTGVVIGGFSDHVPVTEAYESLPIKHSRQSYTCSQHACCLAVQFCISLSIPAAPKRNLAPHACLLCFIAASTSHSM